MQEKIFLFRFTVSVDSWSLFRFFFEIRDRSCFRFLSPEIEPENLNYQALFDTQIFQTFSLSIN
jgi:hypothetical protein